MFDGVLNTPLYWTHSAYYFIVFTVDFEHVYDQRGSWFIGIYKLRTLTPHENVLKCKIVHKEQVFYSFWRCFCKVFYCLKGCPYSDFFWFVFSSFRIVFSPNSRKYEPENLRIRTFSRSVWLYWNFIFYRYLQLQPWS